MKSLFLGAVMVVSIALSAQAQSDDVPFDFSSSGTNLSVTQGTSVTTSYTVEAKLLSGTTQPISFFASGLPAEVTASFSPLSCSPTCTTQLTVNAPPNTPLGTYTVLIGGEGGGVKRTVNFSLAVNPPEDSTPPKISGVSISNVTEHSATVVWTTNEPATSQVEYGIDTTYGLSTQPTTTFVTTHSVALSSLSNGTLYNFRARSKDSSGNEAVSINFDFQTIALLDSIPPAQITTLSIGNPTDTSLSLSWKAVGDDDMTGQAIQYEIRRSSAPPGSDPSIWWGDALSLTGIPLPQKSGLPESYVAIDLAPQTTYYFAVRAIDEADNVSLLATQDIKAGTTLPPPDTTAPEISNVQVTNITPSSTTIAWTTNEPATSQVEYGLTESYGTNTPLGLELIENHSQTLSGLSSETTYHYRVKSKDGAGNLVVSGDGTFATSPAPDVIPPAAIDDLTASSTTENSITLSFTAPGDDGIAGTADSYDIRYSTLPISTTNFADAILVSNPPSPLPAGTSQSLAIGSLESAQTYFLAIKTRDEAGNISDLSNVVQATTKTIIIPDTTSPLISNVQVLGITANSATITWATNEPADSVVKYGTSQFTLPDSETSSALVTDHSVTLVNLKRRKTYYYQVFSKDAAGNTSFTQVNSFQTKSGRPGSTSSPQGGAGSVVLSWEWPDDPFVQKVVLARSTDTFPEAPKESNIIATIGNRLQTSYIDTQTLNGTPYYYSIFAIDDLGLISDPSHVSFVPTDPLAPPSVKKFQARPAQGQVALMWENPTSFPGYVRTRIVRKQGSFPGTPKDGTLVYEGTKQLFTDTNLENNTTYSYAAFALGRTPRYSAPGLAQAKPEFGISSIPFGEETPSLQPAFLFSRTLTIGSQGEDVRKLQELLAADPSLYPEGLVTGYFGPLTQKAVQKFQERNDIVSQGTPETTGYGVVGPRTRAKLNQLRLIQELQAQVKKLQEDIKALLPSSNEI